MRARFHDTVVDAVAKELRLAGLRVACEVGVPGGRIDLVVLSGPRWAWMIEVKTSSASSANLMYAPVQLRRYVEASGHEVSAATLIVPSGMRSLELERAAERDDVDVWTCDFDRLVARMETPARPPTRTFVCLPAIDDLTRAQMKLRAQEWYRANGRAA